MLDTIRFGDEKSEAAHGFCGERSAIAAPERGESCRIALPAEPVGRFGGELGFTLKVHPTKQNYVSVRLFSGDVYTPIFLVIDGMQLGYAKCGDYEALNLCYGGFFPRAFFYCTSALPLWLTRGKTELRLSLRQAQPYEDVTEPKGRIFAAHTHLNPMLPPADRPVMEPKALPHADYSASETNALCEKYISAQRAAFNASLNALRRGETISITKYVESMRQFCMMLYEPYCPAASDAEKGEAVALALNCIDLYVRGYFADVRTLARTTHQSDWGGYYGELGQTLYILEPLIKNDRIFGAERFAGYLSEPFGADIAEGEFSMSAAGLSRKDAWERCLKANFDFASARQSYIYNQTYYTYEGAWKSMAGLGVIGSGLYVGDEGCRRILREALGLERWLGEHRLADENGRELDLYHCLFHHDKEAVFTNDFIQVVCRGKAVQLKDENGDFLRRLPYGRNYRPLSLGGLTRENGYVGNYGETANYLPEWVYRTWNHGDRELSDEIMRAALRNIHARGFMRYQTTDAEGNRIMHMEQGIDERNPAMPGKIAYATDIYDNRRFLFASLQGHMAESPERYGGAEWDIYRAYAAEAVDFARQQRLDGRLDFILEEPSANYNDFRVDRTLRDILAGGPEHVLPHTDYRLYNGEIPVGETEFARLDIDTLTLSLRDGETSIFAALSLRGRGYCAVGRAHVRQSGAAQLLQFTTDGIFEEDGKYIRPQNNNMDFIADDASALAGFAEARQALCGEETPITYQKGIGHVLRENLEVDTPFSGYPDVIRTRIGRYYIIVNTTRESYENARSFTVPTPESGAIYDMVSKTKVNAEGGAVTVPPLTALVLRLEGEGAELPPYRVNILNVLPDGGGNLLQWKHAAGAEEYRIYRNGRLAAAVNGNVWLDAEAAPEEDCTYAVAAANAAGEGTASCPKTVRTRERGKAVTLRVGSGPLGFGEGDDYKALERNIRDSLVFTAKAYVGNVSLTEKLSDGGLMLRENAEANARYAYLGYERGRLVFRVRTKNTMYSPKGRLSPLTFGLEGGPFLRLTRDFAAHTVSAWSSDDGESWRLLRRETFPAPEILYAGTVAPF